MFKKVNIFNNVTKTNIQPIVHNTHTFNVKSSK